MHHSEYTVYRLWTYFPKRMSSGKVVWWDEYYKVDNMTSVDPRHMFLQTTFYSKQEWFLYKLSQPPEKTKIWKSY